MDNAVGAPGRASDPERWCELVDGPLVSARSIPATPYPLAMVGSTDRTRTADLARRRLVRIAFGIAVSSALITSPAHSEQTAVVGDLGLTHQQLLAFRELNGVCIEIRSPGGAFYDVLGVTGDPEVAFTGFSRIANGILASGIAETARELLRAHRVPPLDCQMPSRDLRARLQVEAVWHREADGFWFQVSTHLLDAARLVREPEAFVWSSSWEAQSQGLASPQALHSDVRASVKQLLNRFCRLYMRAHEDCKTQAGVDGDEPATGTSAEQEELLIRAAAVRRLLEARRDWWQAAWMAGVRCGTLDTPTGTIASDGKDGICRIAKDGVSPGTGTLRILFIGTVGINWKTRDRVTAVVPFGGSDERAAVPGASVTYLLERCSGNWRVVGVLPAKGARL